MKDALSSESVTLDLPETSSIESLLAGFKDQVSEEHREYVTKVLPSCMVALNQEYVFNLTQSVKASDEVALIPPISGG